MFRPMFRYTHGLVGSLLRVEAARSVVDALPLPRGATNELRESARKALTQACQLLDGTPANGYAAALSQLAGRSNDSPDEELLASIQASLERSSGYRSSSALVYDQSHTDLIYLPPEAVAVPGLVLDLLDWLEGAWEQLPGAILAGIAQQEVLLIQPFERASASAARLLGGIVLWRKGYGLGGYGSVETELAHDVGAYEQATRSTHSGVYSNPADFTVWLEYYTAAVAAAGLAASGAVQARFEAVQRPRIEGVPPAPLILRDRQRKALDYLRTNGAIRSGEYQKLVHIVPDTARRDFDELMDKELIEVRGVGRGTHYVLTPLGIEETNRRSAQAAAAPEGLAAHGS